MNGGVVFFGLLSIGAFLTVSGEPEASGKLTGFIVGIVCAALAGLAYGGVS